MFCLNCNAALPGNAGVCGRCGMPVNNASPNHPFSHINQTPFPYQNAPTGQSGDPAGYRQDFPGYSQGPWGYGPIPSGPPTAQGGSAPPYGQLTLTVPLSLFLRSGAPCSRAAHSNRGRRLTVIPAFNRI